MRDINILNLDLENLGQDHLIEKRDLRHSIAIINLHKIKISFFALALTLCEILIFQPFVLENLGQGHMVEKRSYAIRWRILTRKVVPGHFSLALTVFQILHIYIFQNLCDLEKIGQDHDVQLLQWDHSIANARLPI